MKPALRIPDVVMAVSLVLLVGCATADSARQDAGRGSQFRAQSAAAEPASTESAAQPSSAATATPRGVSTGADVYFTAPTRSTSCQMTAVASTCDIRDHAYTPPALSADCDLDYGDMVQVQARDAASFLCHGDTAAHPDATVLDYGRQISNGRFVCSSAETGSSCVSTASGHGFELSRDRYRFF